MESNTGPVHTTPEKFENAALFLRLGLPSTLIRHENALQTGEIWKRSFISTVKPTVHTNPARKRSFSKTLFKPEKFENAVLFLRLGLPSTLIRHENGAFQKRSSNRRNLKTQFYFYG